VVSVGSTLAFALLAMLAAENIRKAALE